MATVSYSRAVHFGSIQWSAALSRAAVLASAVVAMLVGSVLYEAAVAARANHAPRGIESEFNGP